MFPGIYSKNKQESWKQVTPAVYDKGQENMFANSGILAVCHILNYNGALPHAPSAINPESKPT
jgi:N-ethylmaleimide reductase